MLAFVDKGDVFIRVKARYFELIGEAMVLCGNMRPASLSSSTVNLDTKFVNFRDFFHSLSSTRCANGNRRVETADRLASA